MDKKAVSEIDKPNIFVESIFDKKEAVTEIKIQMATKWNLNIPALKMPIA